MRQKELEDRVAAREDRIAPELLFQYENLFHVLSVTIRPLSHMQWTRGDTPARTPARQACHIAGSCDAYATGERFKKYKAKLLKLAEQENLTTQEFAFLGEHYEECTFGTPRPVIKALFEMSSSIHPDYLYAASNPIRR